MIKFIIVIALALLLDTTLWFLPPLPLWFNILFGFMSYCTIAGLAEMFYFGKVLVDMEE